MDKQLMAYVPLFMGLTEDEQETLTSSFSAGQLTANGLLFKAGTQSEALYLLEQGFVRLTTESGQNLATLGPGSLLGDAALLGGSSNDVSAVAVSELKYSKLTDRQLRELMLQEPAIGLRLSQNFGRLIVQMQDYLVQTLSRTNELSSLPAHTLQAIAQQLQPRALRAQEILYRVGDQPGGLYVIERGAFEVRPEGTVTDQAVTRVQSGAILGALAMLTN